MKVNVWYRLPASHIYTGIYKLVWVRYRLCCCAADTICVTSDAICFIKLALMTDKSSMVLSGKADRQCVEGSV